MISIGVDAHKSIHVALAVDEAGREVGDWQGPNSEVGLAQPRHLGLRPRRMSAVGHRGRLGIRPRPGSAPGPRGETVYEINARWTAMRRRSAHKPGKTDQLDASAIALFVRQEPGDLPRVLPEDDTADT